MSFSIVTGNGFLTNAQRGKDDGTFNKTNGIAAFYNTGYTLLNNFKYNLSFKYRASSGVTCLATPTTWQSSYWNTPDNINECFLFDTIGPNTGSCTLTGLTFYCFPGYLAWSTTNQLNLTFPKHLGFSCVLDTIDPGSFDGNWLEIDEVNLYHVYPPSSPMCSTLAITDFTTTGFTLNGMVNPYGLSTNAYFTIDVNSPHSITNYQCNENPMDGHLVNFNVNKIVPYTSNRYIDVTLYATNSSGGVTGNTLSTYTPNTPSIYLSDPSNFTATGITLNGGGSVYWLPTYFVFEWGTSSGVYTQSTLVTTGNNSFKWNGSYMSGITSDTFLVNLSGLTTGYTYYYRLKGTNGLGSTYTSEQKFRTVYTGYKWSTQGGVPFYFYDSTHTSGIIAAENDLSTGLTWGCQGYNITTNSTGEVNTTNIVNNCTGLTIAARMCYNLSLSGFSDWWLPSSAELGSMCNNQNYIGGFVTNVIYWSSNQNSSTQAIGNRFDNCGTNYLVDKDSARYVRPIRYFNFS